MSKFDLIEKIRPVELLCLFKKSKHLLPFELIQPKLGLSLSWQPSYFNWGRNALYYLFKSLPYKEITFPAFTCPTLIKAAEQAGKKVILTEVDLKTFNIDINKIPSKTKCLVVVHTFGNPVEIIKIKEKFKEIFIIEDCAHALFSKVKNNFAGSQGDAILFSLYKQIANLNGCLLLTKRKIGQNQEQEGSFKYLKRLIIKLSGPHQYYLDFKRKQYLPVIEEQKTNCQMPSDLTFSLFEKGFKKLEKEVEERRKVVQFYYQQLKGYEFLKIQESPLDANPSYYQFAVRLIPRIASYRDKIVFSLRKKNIIIDRLWYEAPIVQKKYELFQKKCPQALILAKTVINLPIYSFYTKADVNYLFSQVQKVIEEQLDGEK